MIYKPFEDELGQRIYDSISQEAWQGWLEHSKMLVNEYRLELNTEKAHEVLKEQCKAFLFEEGDVIAPPPDFVPETTGDSADKTPSE